MFKFCLLIVAALALGPQAVKGQVVGGVNAGSDGLHYHVFLMHNDQYLCSGAIINSKYFLTAAHCIHGMDIRGFIAIVGTNDIESGGQRLHLMAMESYPTYVKRNPPDWVNDIGICKLQEDVQLSNNIAMVTLPNGYEIDMNSNAVCYGAGHTRHREPCCGGMCFGGPNRHILQKLSVTIINLDTCRSKLNRLGNYRVDVTHICTIAERGRGTVAGDSGGPLVQNGVIIGILSGGIDPPAKGHPEIFMKVSEYLYWIRDIIFEDEE